jgi:hypothetical protein
LSSAHVLLFVQGSGRPPTLFKVTKESKLSEVLVDMVRGGYHEVAVEDARGKITGVLSRDNIFSMIAQGDGS